MSDAKPEILAADPAGVARAALLLAQGELVAFPTETVYGLGADASDDAAVAWIFAAKNRPRFNPLIVHVADMQMARDLADFSDAAQRLTDAFWPGPLTLVLPLKSGGAVSPLVSAGLTTIAIRVPAHPLAQALLREFGHPVAAPSANPSGKLSPTRPAHVIAGLGPQIAAILDGGACAVGLESTIVGFDPSPVLLRPGGLPVEVLEQCLGQPLGVPEPQSRPNAPGQLPSHYAPNSALRLDARDKSANEVLLGFGPVNCDLNLSPSGDLTEAAANLFGHLRELDTKNAQIIAVSPIPDHGLGRAINDRLKRAAAPRA